MRTFLCAAILALGTPAAAFAQHSADAAAPTSANAPAEAKQFDFLLGQWELDVHPKVSGLAAMIHGAPKLSGIWKAWRALDGLVIEDEMRIVDASGNPKSLTRAQRIWSMHDARWKVVMIDAYHGRTSESSGQMQGAEMHTESRSTDAEGKTVLTRTRYYDISADGFRMQQDRSEDNGQTWDEGTLAIDAKRSAASASP
jgi:hypothetical protein